MGRGAPEAEVWLAQQCCWGQSRTLPSSTVSAVIHGAGGGGSSGEPRQSPEEGPFHASDEYGEGFRGMPEGRGGLAVGSVSSGRPSCPGSSPSAEGFPHLLAPAPLPLLVLGCSGVGTGVDSGETGSGEKEKKNLFLDAPGLQTKPLETLLKSTGGAWKQSSAEHRLSGRPGGPSVTM